MKINFKILVAMIILLATILVFNLKTVQATENTEEVIDLQKILRLIPDKVELNIPQREALVYAKRNGFDSCKAINLVLEQIDEIFKKENVDSNKVSFYLFERTQLLDSTLQYIYSINFNNNPTGTGDLGAYIKYDGYNMNVHTLKVKIYDYSSYKAGINTPVKPIAEKEIKISYADTYKYNTEDEQYVKNKCKDINFESLNFEYDFEKYGFYESFLGESFEGMITDVFSKIINDSTLKVDVKKLGCGEIYPEHGYALISKDGIVYLLEPFYISSLIPTIILPDNIEDTDEAYINYALEIINEKINKDNIAREVDSIVKSKEENKFIVKYKNSDYEEEFIIRKNKVEPETKVEVDEKTNIKLDAPADVVPEDTVMEVEPIEEGEKFEEIKETMEKTDVKKFKVFDITLTSKGVKIQPNGKVKISIPIPNNFNTANLIVYRVEEDGKKIGYSVEVYEENNLIYARFETDHFSNYVLAETEPEPIVEKELDDTPKTGVIDITNYVFLMVIISAVGIVVLKRKEA